MIMLLNEGAKPTIVIHVSEGFGGKNILNQICYGIEEEGIPYEVITLNANNHVEMAYAACLESRLGVGIGVANNGIALHFDKLKPEEPLFEISPHDGIEKIRIIGTNGARLVKRLPFKPLEEVNK